MSSTLVKKSAPHRKAIAEAATLTAAPGKPNTLNGTTTKTMSRTNNKECIGQESNNSPNAGTEQTDDYETAKVSKNRKAQHDAEIQMVADLDRWG
jgi:hypothetical protein